MQLKASAILLFAALGAAPLSAGVESLKVEPTFVPRLSPVMEMEGVTEGKLVVAIAVDETGKLTDTLAVAYTHPALVRPCIEAMKEWKFTPVRVDGQAIAAQTELTIDYSAEGVVISRSSGLDVDRYFRGKFGSRYVKSMPRPDELDRVPVLVKTVTPLYAKQAESQGVKGAVDVYFYIDETGAVRLPSVGVGSNPYLAESALTAVREWRFEPPTHRGRPVMISARQVFKFGS